MMVLQRKAAVITMTPRTRMSTTTITRTRTTTRMTVRILSMQTRITTTAALTIAIFSFSLRRRVPPHAADAEEVIEREVKAGTAWQDLQDQLAQLGRQDCPAKGAKTGR